ncbi:MAG: carboxypeptidase-like regulatory domain-containing protein [Dehalococcoidales bacterium]
MIGRIALLAVVFILSLIAPTLAAEPDTGTIEGQVVNGTEGGSSVADQDVTLKTFLNDAEVGTTTTKTDAEGRFVFGGLSTESSYNYQVALTFQGTEYTSVWLNFDEGETTKSTEVIVYDSTTSDEAIKVAMTHTIVYVGQGSLQVQEYFLFVNEADRTYIGPTEDGNTGTLKFSLPRGVAELQYSLGLMECCIVGSEEGFADTMPVLPGSKEVAYSYKVNYSSAAYTFSQRVNYPTANFDLLIQSEDIEITGNQLAIDEPLDIGGTRFNHLFGRDLTPGDILVVQLSGLPETSNQSTLGWVTLTLVALVGGFSFIYFLRKRRLQSVIPDGSLEQRKQRLLIELARLDDDFEGGKITEDVYRKLRVTKKAQLLELIQRSKKEKGNR